MITKNLMHDDVLHRFVSIKKFNDKTYKNQAEKYYENLMKNTVVFNDEKSMKKHFEFAFLFGFYFGILNDNFGDLYEDDDVFNSFSEVKDSVLRDDFLLDVLLKNEFEKVLETQDICSTRLVELYESIFFKEFILFSFLIGVSQAKEIVIPVPKRSRFH